MLKQLTMLSLVLATAITGITLENAKSANAAGKCTGNCNTDSVLYICIKNTTQKSVYVKGETDSTNFLLNKAEPGESYVRRFQRPRDDDRTVTVYLDGQAAEARYKWTGQTPRQLDDEQACFFNQWDVKKGRNGSLYMRSVS